MRDEGFAVLTAGSGEEGLRLMERERVDLVILDINLPGIDGLEVCHRIKTTAQIPVIFLSARDRDSDVISGLETGADDYMRKPFNHRELILRIGKLLKLAGGSTEGQTAIRTGKLLINRERETVFFDSREIKLTPMEYNLLAVLGSRLDWVISWQVLLKEAWGYEDWEGGREIVKVNIRRLRIKIEPDPSEPIYLLTERGRGYKLACVR